MKRGSVCPVLTPTQARFLLSAARRAKEECTVGDERRTWDGAYRALSLAIQKMRTAALCTGGDRG
ncbi:MAG TPA: hypothetical protein VGI97_00535 [Gemmatimonadaceae bacterium]|jgi:hypothetical protein